MAFRQHVVAAHGVEAEALERHLETPGSPLGPWRVSAALSVWSRDAGHVDRRLALLSRETGGVVLRATTVDDDHVVVSVQCDGRRVALFDHPFGGLRRRELLDTLELAVEDLDEDGSRPEGADTGLATFLDTPVAPELLDDIEDFDDEILSRLAAGETPRHAWEEVTHQRADALAAELTAAGVAGVDARRLLAALRGRPVPRAATSQGAESEPDVDVAEIEELWGDLPELLEALGISGIAGWLVRESGVEEVDDSDDDGREEPLDAYSGGTDPDESTDDEGWRSRIRELGCGALLASMIAGAVAGAFLARGYESNLAAVGAAALGLVTPLLVLGLLLAARFALPLLLLGRALRKKSRQLAEVDAAAGVTRTGWIRHLEPADVAPARRILADWSDGLTELGREPGRITLFGHLYGDALLPTGPEAQSLLSALRRPGAARELEPRVTTLRRELLDRRLAGEPVDDLLPRWQAVADVPPG